MADITVVHNLSPEDNLRAAYHTLSDRVIIALRTQVGDMIRLNEIRAQVFQLIEAAEAVSGSVHTRQISFSDLSLHHISTVNDFLQQNSRCCRLTLLI